MIFNPRFLLVFCLVAGLVACTPGKMVTKPDSLPPLSGTTPVTPAAATPRVPKVALALGGGAARGFAHIGVIKILEAHNIKVEIIAGTSAGSVVGSLYASGLNAFELQQMALRMDESVFADWTLGNRGMFRGEALQQWVNQQMNQRVIEQLPRKLGITATDLASGEAILFQRGNIGIAVRASSSVPGVFTPVAINGREYVDGGLTAPVPVQAARSMGGDIVIAVDISTEPSGQTTQSVTELLLQTFAIMGRAINRHELSGADIVIRPVLNTRGTDFSARHLAILAGEQAALAALPKIKQRLGEKSTP
jgi:NTE family protein